MSTTAARELHHADQADEQDGEEGVELSPEAEEWFDEMIRETDADFAAGRYHTSEEIRSMLAAAR